MGLFKTYYKHSLLLQRPIYNLFDLMDLLMLNEVFA